MAVKKKTSKEAAGGPLNDRAQKLKALGVTMEHLEKDFGSGAVMCLGDDKIQNVARRRIDQKCKDPPYLPL